MEFRTLGPLQVVDAGRALALGSALQRAVLAVMLVEAPEPVSVDRLIDELWGERPPASAQHAVQVYVSAIRKLLRTGGGDVSVRTTGSAYALEVDADRVDAKRFQRLVADAQQLAGEAPSRAGELFGEALGLWRGAPLAEFAQFEFARREAERLEELHTTAVEGLVEARLARGEDGEVLGMITGLVAASPLRERPRRLLMLALYRSGRHAEALEAYRDACTALDEIGLQPGPELRQLEAAILRHDSALALPDVTTDASELDLTQGRSLSPSNVSAPANRLVGRRAEIVKALELLANGEVRLLSLLGPGGVGKTRLAIEIASRAAGNHQHGTWMVSLASITDQGVMTLEIARVLGVEPTAGQPWQEMLYSALVDRELLLVLDNLEQLPGAAGVVADLLAAAPRLHVLATSREPLRVRGEHRMEIQPLPLEDASELFVQRAIAVRSDLSLDDEDHAAIERICMRLDGLPLALELVAARIAAFGPRSLEARLAQRLALPEGPRDLPDRQRTVRATIDWSYRLLEPAERTLFWGLSTFIGGVRIDSAESIWGAEVIEYLISLTEKSLLGRREDDDQEPRFWMLETIREFALERGAAEDADPEAASRHASYFLALTEQAAPHLLGPEQHLWADRLERDQANIGAAVDYLTEREPVQALRMAANLIWFWELRGYGPDAYRQVQRTLAGTPRDTQHRGWALFGAGLMALRLGEAAQDVQTLLLEALSIARQQGDQRVAVLALSNLGVVAEATGEHAESTARHREAVSTARAAGDHWALGVALNGYATYSPVSGDPQRTRKLLEESLRIRRRTGEPRGIAMTAGNLAIDALAAGELEYADSLVDEAMARAREINFRFMIANGLGIKAQIALLRDDLDGALALLRDQIDAISPYQVGGLGELMSFAATIAAQQHDPLRAATLWAAADKLFTRHWLPEEAATKLLRAQWQTQARAAVADQQAWDAAQAAGAELSREDALALARGDQTTGKARKRPPPD